MAMTSTTMTETADVHRINAAAIQRAADTIGRWAEKRADSRRRGDADAECQFAGWLFGAECALSALGLKDLAELAALADRG